MASPSSQSHDDDNSSNSSETESPRRLSTDSSISTDSKESGGSGVTTRSNGRQSHLRTTPARHQKKRSTKSTSSRVSGRLSKVTKRGVKRKNRENVTTSDFLLANLPWSKWKEGVTSLPPNGRTRGAWEQRHDDHVGVRNTHLFAGETDRPSVYEVAVQPGPGAPKYPVACAVTSGFHQRAWDRVVLKDYTHYQVDRVLKRGCKLLVRRASVRPDKTSSGTVEDSLKELRSLIGRHYDYAWKCRYDVDTRTYPNRLLFRNDTMISDGGCPAAR